MVRPCDDFGKELELLQPRRTFCYVLEIFCIYSSTFLVMEINICPVVCN